MYIKRRPLPRTRRASVSVSRISFREIQCVSPFPFSSLPTCSSSSFRLGTRDRGYAVHEVPYSFLSFHSHSSVFVLPPFLDDAPTLAAANLVAARTPCTPQMANITNFSHWWGERYISLAMSSRGMRQSRRERFRHSPSHQSCVPNQMRGLDIGSKPARLKPT